jgi:polyphosphate kinase 2
MAKSKARTAKAGRAAGAVATSGRSDSPKAASAAASGGSKTGSSKTGSSKTGPRATAEKGRGSRTAPAGARERKRSAPVQREDELDPGLVNPPADTAAETRARKISTKDYLAELGKLQVELIKLQEWIRDQGLRAVIAFEGRDAAGKGGAIKTITQSLNPRFARVVALGTPTEREKTQWYFQRYVPHLPAAGEMVLFDRSWYNRAGVERVMGFCSDEEYAEFLRACPEFERMLVRSEIVLIKYWFSVSDAEQERRFRGRIDDPTKRWKLSPMDLQSRARWVEYSKAKDEMFRHTDIKQAPWYVVNADNKKRARLNVIRHLLSLIPYQDLTPEPIVLPPREPDKGYVRPPMTDQTFVPEPY